MTALTTHYGRSRLASVSRNTLGLGHAYLRWHVFTLLGYAVAGKGFAYLGVHPLYIGEMTLAFGLVVALVTKAWLRIPRTPTSLLLLGFQAWGGVRTVPGVLAYGVDALRDSVIWAYGLFALLIAGIVISRPFSLAWLVSRFGKFRRIFLAVVPGLWVVQMVYGDSLPRVPGSEIAILYLKDVDALAHLAGIANFQLVGLASTSLWSLVVLWIGFVVLSVCSRTGMLAFLLSVGLVSAVRPLRRRLWFALAATAFVAPLFLATSTGITTKNREIAGWQLLENVASIVHGDSGSNRGGTRAWRLRWWSDIVDYTVFGPNFWHGKGFGINLAWSDGIRPERHDPLRSPHNSHLTILARTGVPGFLLWALVQLSWLREMARGYRRSRSAGQYRWSQLFLFLMAYWLAFIVNGVFDVYLEGPMGGIWFWSVFGVGLAATRIYERWPDVLAAPTPPHAHRCGVFVGSTLPQLGREP